MQEYLVNYGSRTIDIDNYIFPQKFPYRPLQDEYITAVEKTNTREKKLFKICKIVHGMEEDVPVLTLFISR